MKTKYEEVSEYAQAYALNTDKKGCAENFVQGYKQCSDISCYFDVSMFGGVCVAAAKGDIKKLCHSAFNESGIATQCKENNFDEKDCNSVASFYQAICNDDS
ncbi:MAG: hypothetical protein HRU04_24070 [Oceanospirillaceae bacterium]|nr:hypothetical protein [Oceanospirillaceae bacterium]